VPGQIDRLAPSTTVARGELESARQVFAILIEGIWFAQDSPLEETVLSELVSEPNSLVTGKNTGIFIVGASEYN
jgi:hypothetical protein